MLKEDGRVTFSKLYNNSEFSPEEQQYLGRLYEIIFAIPAYLRDYFQSSGKIPTTTEMAQHFGIGEQSVLLLLEVLESDSRVPDLYLREPKSGQITSLNMERIERFLERRGSKVRVTQWEGMSLPGFEVKTLENERLSNDQILGHNALLYFWFTGCPPCVRIAPILAELANEYQPSGFRFYGLNADDVLEIGTDNKARRTYLLKQGIHFLNANLNNATREAFGNVNVYPTLFFVNRNGIIVRHLVNFQTRATLVDVIKQMLE
jgi:thiol-disulfide isomerase/thioredoxin